MSTYHEAFCNITTDLEAVEPDLHNFDLKRRVSGAASIVQSGSPADVYTFHNTGNVTLLFRDGVDLGAAQSAGSSVDGNVDGEWYYDADADYLKVACIYDPDGTSGYTLEAGRDWSDVRTEAVKRASELVRALAGKPILKRTGTGVQDAPARDYEELIVRCTAHLAVSDLIRPYNVARAAEIQSVAHNAEGTGWLDMIRKGELALWNESAPTLNEGAVKVVSQNASSTGTIVDVEGKPWVTWDAVKVMIVTGGTFVQGSASTVTYSVWQGDSTGIKTSQVVTAAVITGAYQNCAHGLSIRFGPGVYTANDEWEIEVRGDEPQAGTDWGSYPMSRI